MTPARWTFVVIFGLSLVIGLLIGIMNLVNPDSANIVLNGQKVTGMTGFWKALMSGAIPGLIFGLIVAGIVALFTRRKRAT
jgi:hypothetical protein